MSLVPLYLALGVSVYLLLGILYFAVRRSDYSHVRHTISELGETGSPVGRRVSLGVFLPTGAVLFGVAYLLSTWPAPEELRLGSSSLALCIGVGYAGAALFPCDPGSPLEGSWRQQVHNLAGAVEYVGGAASLAVAGRFLQEHAGSFGLSAIIIFLAGVVLVGGIALSIRMLFPWRGMIQRIAELVLFASLLLLTGEILL